MNFDAHQLDVFLLWGSAVTLLAIGAVRISSRAGLPTLLLYLGIGVLLGESGLGISFDNGEVAHALGFGALVVILAEGGLTTSWSHVRPAMRLGASLATVGMVCSVAIVGVGAHYLLDLRWELALILGAAISATDAAAVFSVLRAVPLPSRISGALEAESGLNDAPAVVLVVLISAGDAADHAWWWLVGIVIFELAVGVVIGGVVGWCGGWVMRRAALPSSGLYPIAVICLTLFAYAAGAAVHASGFAAVYVAALILGNLDLPHRAATRSFAEGLAWIAQIGLFVMLGLLASPARLTWETVGLGLLVGLILTVVARPISVAVASLAQPMPWRDLVFISWAGMRGAVPVVFATIPLAAGVPGSTELFDIVFVMVVVYTLITGPTLPWVGARLGVVLHDRPRGYDVEVAPLDHVAADLLQIKIARESKMHGVEVGELRLPVGASVSMIIRDEATMVPQMRTALRRGDVVLVVTPRKLREATERRLSQVSQSGRLGRWLGATGQESET